jgi:SOS response regulatory protein OraA/RecX
MRTFASQKRKGRKPSRIRSYLLFSLGGITGRGAKMVSMNKADAVQQIKKTAKEQFGKYLSDGEIEQSIADYFNPNIPSPDFSQEQIDDVIRSLFPDEE